MVALVGRDDELRRLLAVLDDGLDTPRGLVVTAEAGMGKSVLVDALREEAGRRGRRTLFVRPLEAEASLAFSGLGELLADVAEEVYDDLPPPQRTAIRAALLLDETDRPIDPRAVAAGVGSLLRSLCEREPVLIVVDDGHWLDAASSQALGRGLRRTPEIRLVAAARPEGRPLEEWVPDWSADRIHLAGLSADEIARLVRDRLGMQLDRPSGRALANAAGGNPLFAIELARHRAGRVAETFGRLVGARIRELPRGTRLALLTTALSSAPGVELVAAARDCRPAELLDLLEPAVAADLVRVTDWVDFVHPLYAAAVIQESAAVDVTAAHERLADLEPTDEARARHLGAARTEPDETLAARLEDAARRARERGGVDSALELLQLAVQRTPPTEDRERRAVLLARGLLQAGRTAESVAWSRQVRGRGPGPSYWEATLLLGNGLLWHSEWDEARALAAELAAGDPAPLVRAEALVTLLSEFEGIEAALAGAEEAIPILRRHGSPGQLAAALAMRARYRRQLLMPGDPAAVAEALSLEAIEAPALVMESIELELAHARLNEGRLAESRELYERLLRRCAETGDDLSVPMLCVQSAQLETWAGDWDRALELLDAGHRIAEHQGPFYLTMLAVGRARVHGFRGDRALAEETLAGAIQELGRYGPLWTAIAWAALGDVRDVHGDHEAAYEAYVHANRSRAEADWRDPSDLRCQLDLAEAAIAVGRPEEAVPIVDAVGAWATGADHRPSLVECGRVRMRLSVAVGDLEPAIAAVPELLARVDDEFDPLRRGRTWLAAGMALRRGKQRRAAHDALTTAVAIFERLGCAPYADRARAELARVGLRQQRGDVLTTTEAKVAGLAARGLRNTDIAAECFLSVKTVEATLGRAYRKLGISRRAELARALDALRG